MHMFGLLFACILLSVTHIWLPFYLEVYCHFFSALSLSRPLCVSFRSFQWNWYSIHLIFIYIDIDLILSYGRFDSNRLFFVSTSRPSWCCSIVIQSLGFSLAPDFIQIERSKRIKTLHSIAFLSAFTTVFFSLSLDDYCSIWNSSDSQRWWYFRFSLSLFHPMAIKHLNISLH